MFENLRADVAAYKQHMGQQWYAHRGFWIGANYRFGRWVYTRAPELVRKPLTLVHKITSAPLRALMNLELAREADIGGGLLLLHPHNILIPPGSKLGRECAIFHDVTFGALGNDEGRPVLEDHVVVFAGARLIGGVHIGARAEIGPNAVVMRDVPAGATFSAAVSRAVPKHIIDLTRAAAARAEASTKPAG